jgi:hypothetical protein
MSKVRIIYKYKFIDETTGEVLVNNDLKELTETVKIANTKDGSHFKRVWTVDNIKELLQTSDKMVCKSILKIYQNQTRDEQASENTIEQNGIGFNGIDAQILTSFAKQYIEYGRLSSKQIALGRKKIMKYARQLANIASRIQV